MNIRGPESGYDLNLLKIIVKVDNFSRMLEIRSKKLIEVIIGLDFNFFS